MGKSGRELLEERIGQIWTIHLHNQWNKKLPDGGWTDQLFERYHTKLDMISREREKAVRGVEVRDIKEEAGEDEEVVHT